MQFPSALVVLSNPIVPELPSSAQQLLIGCSCLYSMQTGFLRHRKHMLKLAPKLLTWDHHAWDGKNPSMICRTLSSLNHQPAPRVVEMTLLYRYGCQTVCLLQCCLPDAQINVWHDPGPRTRKKKHAGLLSCLREAGERDQAAEQQ